MSDDEETWRMREGELASLKCSKEYTCIDRESMIELSLDRIYVYEDLSFEKDKSMMKKRVSWMRTMSFMSSFMTSISRIAYMSM